jgi:hypothetical protein
MSGLTIAEVCESLKSAKTKNDRVEILKNNDTQALRGLLRLNYDASLIVALPEGAPPFKPLNVPVGFGNTTLKASARGWYVFVQGAAPNLKQAKREALFIDLLESLDSKEAEILIGAKDRKLDLGLTKKVIDEVFPGLIKSEGKIDGKKDKSTKNTRTAIANTGDGEATRADSDV